MRIAIIGNVFKKKYLYVILIILFTVLPLTGCKKSASPGEENSMSFLNEAGFGIDNANAEGWYMTMDEKFEGTELNSLWTPSPHGLRDKEYWCDQMVSIGDGKALIKAETRSGHECGVCGVSEGWFTSGIETRKMVDGKSVNLFEQAFGYFEARVNFPDSRGMWSAFWLQTESIGNIGNDGKDGSEIDIYESSFYNTSLFPNNRNRIGHAIHYDGYGKEHKVKDAVFDMGYDLHEGFHLFSVLWTPEGYTFYVDRKETWKTDFGGVCKVPAFVRLTCEIRGNVFGPYSQLLGKFDGGVFEVDYVRIYQNKAYLEHIKSPADFQ